MPNRHLALYLHARRHGNVHILHCILAGVRRWVDNERLRIPLFHQVPNLQQC
jgi:hypothetical protein